MRTPKQVQCFHAVPLIFAGGWKEVTSNAGEVDHSALDEDHRQPSCWLRKHELVVHVQ